MTENELIEYYADLFDLARRCTKSREEAEEITSDTILSALEDIRAGKPIDNPAGYLRTLLYRRKSDYLRRKYRDACVVWGDERILRVPERRSGAAAAEADERKIRRELSRLTGLYREVMVRHYMKGESVAEISAALGIPEGTVKRRLSSGRQQVRDGFCSMENTSYSSLSYSPKNVQLGIWGSPGSDDSPFSLLNNSKLAQNLLILAYRKPMGVRALSDALGVPTPYIEPELERLTAGELMGRTPGGLYYTRIFLTEESKSYGDIPAQERIAGEFCGRLWDCLRSHTGELLESPGCKAMSEKQRTTLLLFMLQEGVNEAILKIEAAYRKAPENPPSRPYDGHWLAAGTIDDGNRNAKYDSSGPVVVMHRSPDQKRVDYMMHDFQSAFGDTHWVYGKLKHRFDLRQLLTFYVSFMNEAVRPDDERIYELVPEFERLHILRRDADGSAKLDVPALSWAEHMRVDAAFNQIGREFSDILREPLSGLIEAWDNDLPPTVDAPEYYRSRGALGAFRLAVLYAVYERGLTPSPVQLGETPIIYIVY